MGWPTTCLCFLRLKNFRQESHIIDVMMNAIEKSGSLETCGYLSLMVDKQGVLNAILSWRHLSEAAGEVSRTPWVLGLITKAE